MKTDLYVALLSVGVGIPLQSFSFVIKFLLHTLFIRADYECFQIELSKNYGNAEWREDLKNIMLKAGLNNVQITFLFVDTQVSYIYSLNHGCYL